MSDPISQSAQDQLFGNGRSYNGFLDKSVGNDQLEAIWELMKFGPTSANMLPARLIWCVSDAAKAKLAGFAGDVNGPKIMAAPATVILGMDVDFHEQLPWLFPHNLDAKNWFADGEARKVMALRNSSMQGGYFIMAARALGLDTGPMSGFDNAGVDAAFFGDTPNVKSNFISMVGYGDPSTIFERSPRPPFDTFNSIA